jgi:uncharacterized membrane protein
MKHFALNKTNYIIIGIAVALIVVGFFLMYGSTTDVEFNPDIFSFRRITLAPIVCMIGFIMVIAGIIWKPKSSDENTPKQQ